MDGSFRLVNQIIRCRPAWLTAPLLSRSESRFPGSALGVAKFHPSAAEGEFSRRNSSTGTVAHNITMKQFAEFSSGPLDGPVTDQTNLPGRYDLQLEFTRYVDLAPADPSALPSAAYVLNAALKGELGLQITPRRTNFDVPSLIMSNLPRRIKNEGSSTARLSEPAARRLALQPARHSTRSALPKLNHRYSSRSATSGSTWLARRAGI